VHRDRLHPYATTVKTELPIRDYNEALTFAIRDLVDNWSAYQRRYEEWLAQR
jgi:hypothetical protein